MDVGGLEAKTTILVVDDHPMWCDILTRQIEDVENLDCVGTALNGVEALSRISSLGPDIVLLDIDMPQKSGLDVLREAEDINGLVLSTITQPQTLLQAIDLGAKGYCRKTSPWTDIHRAIDAVNNGDMALDRHSTNILFENIKKGRNRAALSDQELKVLQMTAEDTSTDAIASELVITPGTVRSHLKHIYRKLGVNNGGPAAVAKAIRQGLID